MDFCAGYRKNPELPVIDECLDFSEYSAFLVVVTFGKGCRVGYAGSGRNKSSDLYLQDYLFAEKEGYFFLLVFAGGHQPGSPCFRLVCTPAFMDWL